MRNAIRYATLTTIAIPSTIEITVLIVLDITRSVVVSMLIVKKIDCQKRSAINTIILQS